MPYKSKLKNRNYMFTLFDFEEGKEGEIVNLDAEIRVKDNIKKIIKYIIYQKEQCPETGRLHLQGYVELNAPLRYKKLKELAFNSEEVHFDERRGTREEAIAYCEKEETKIDGPWEHGIRGDAQGHRTDLDEVHDMINNDSPMCDIVAKHFSSYVRYGRGIEKAREIIRRKKIGLRLDLQVTVLYGDTGTGKTRSCYEDIDIDQVYKTDLKNNGNIWFDGYDGQKRLVIDEFKGQIDLQYLLSLLDIYPLKLPTKGSSTQAEFTEVYITSNKDPEDWYDWAVHGRACHDALFRRLHTIKQFIDMDKPSNKHKYTTAVP